MAHPEGTKVRQIVPAIEGETADTRFNKEAGCLEYLVDYFDADGEPAQRWFLESEVEAA